MGRPELPVYVKRLWFVYAQDVDGHKCYRCDATATGASELEWLEPIAKAGRLPACEQHKDKDIAVVR